MREKSLERRCDHFMRHPEVADYCSSLKLMPFESATFNPIAKIRSKNQGSKTEGGGCGFFLAPHGQRVTRSCSAISVGRRLQSKIHKKCSFAKVEWCCMMLRWFFRWWVDGNINMFSKSSGVRISCRNVPFGMAEANSGSLQKSE